VIPQKRRRGGNRPLRLTVTRLERGLYKIEVSETLENGNTHLTNWLNASFVSRSIKKAP